MPSEAKDEEAIGLARKKEKQRTTKGMFRRHQEGHIVKIYKLME